MPAGEEPDGASVQVRMVLFGGVRIVRDDIDIDVTHSKQRGLLALLLVNAGDVVSVDAIVDVLWAGEPAATAVNQVHRHVGALRRMCEPGLRRRQSGRFIFRAGRGYRIVPHPDLCDVSDFRRLAGWARQLSAAGERSTALQVSLKAVAIAASPAGDEGMLDLPEFAALEDERVLALLVAAHQCRREADYAAVLPALRAAVARHPFDEALAARLMDALTRTGRPADALRVHHAVRQRLRVELGCEPQADLRRAFADALNADLPARPTDGGRRQLVPNLLA